MLSIVLATVLALLSFFAGLFPLVCLYHHLCYAYFAQQLVLWHGFLFLGNLCIMCSLGYIIHSLRLANHELETAEQRLQAVQHHFMDSSSHGSSCSTSPLRIKKRLKRSPSFSYFSI